MQITESIEWSLLRENKNTLYTYAKIYFQQREFWQKNEMNVSQKLANHPIARETQSKTHFIIAFENVHILQMWYLFFN